MAKIYKTTDRLTYKVDDITIKIAPLNMEQKVELSELMVAGRQDIKKAMEGTVKVLRYALKEVKGLEDSDGNDFELEFDSGMLTEECAEMLLNIEQSPKMIALCSSFVGGVPSELPEGVKSVPKPKALKKK